MVRVWDRDLRRYRRQAQVEIKVFANVQQVKIMVNDRELPVQDGVSGVYRWPGIQLRAGENRITATGIFAAGAVSDEVIWQVGR